MDISRRSLLAMVALPMAETHSTAARDALDHLLLGVSDLDHGMAWVREHLGTTAAVGGSHPGKGTRNALLSLGARHYLEIIAPDPKQTVYRFAADVRGMKEPRLVTWAARSLDIEATAQRAREAGFAVSGPQAGSRLTPGGKMLHWKTLAVEHPFAVGPVNPIPFFIEWGAGTTHPSESAPAGCVLEAIEFEHPRAAAVAEVLAKLGLAAKVKAGDAARLHAALRTPKGLIHLS